MSVRVRMAPSPTGLLHIGGVHTFLFNWLFARGQAGECLLRIENTDTSREVDEATEQIQRSLTWLGIDWDGPVTFQLDAMSRCRELAAQLVAEGKAYEDEGAIRFRMPDEGVTGWDDAVRGRIEFPNEQLEDVVIVRSDGRPTYNFASPVEDMDDAITHVIRGDDHISNTPKQIQILRALGHEPPVYAHIANILGTDGKKLSKRHGAVSVDEFRTAGYLPEALVNFLALIGWAPDGETTILSRDEIVERFTLEAVSTSPGTFDYAKLDWMNGVYLRALPTEEYAERLVEFVHERGSDWPDDGIRAAAPLVQEKIGRLGEFPDFAGFLFEDVAPPADGLDPRILRAADEALDGTEPWTAAAIETALKELCVGARREAAHRVRADPRRDHRLARLAGPLRVARAARPRDVARAAAPRRRGRGMSALDPQAFEHRLDTYLQERSEEARAVRVGEKETSEQAAIVARYADLFTREQLETLAGAEAATTGDDREEIARLRLTCQEGIVDRELAEREDALENALLAARVPWGDDELPLRSAQARLAVEAAYADRDALGAAVLEVSASFNDERRSLLAARNELEADVTGVARPRRPQRGGEGRPAPPDSRRGRRSAGRGHAGVHAAAGAVARPPARARPRGDACAAPTWRGSGASRRSRRRTRRSGACPSVSRRSQRSASTSRPSRASGPISRTGRRSRRAPA